MNNSLLGKSSFQIFSVNNTFVCYSIPSKACLKRPFTKNSYHMETWSLNLCCKSIDWFLYDRSFIEGSFRTVYTTSGINCIDKDCMLIEG